MRSNDARAAERDRQTGVRAEWQLVATVVDRILLVIFVATTVGVTTVLDVQCRESQHAGNIDIDSAVYSPDFPYCTFRPDLDN